MSKLRFYLALWTAKLARVLLILLGRKSTYFPGKLALKICPAFLKYIGKPEKILAVTGTNGKTTVCNLVIDVLEKSGYRVLHNRAGSNIAAGVATSLINGCNAAGHTRFNLAVFEIDERSSRIIYKDVRPMYILITNLFRDSMMRNAHAEFIAEIVSQSIPPETTLILNGNDLISTGIAPQNKRIYYGIDDMDRLSTSIENIICDVQICPECHDQLVYDYKIYHHIGKAHCPACGFKSPECDYLVTRFDDEKRSISVKDRQGEHALPIPNHSVFNTFNAAGVAALLREVGLSYDDIVAGLQDVAIIESRFSDETVCGIKVVTQLAKELNPIACSRAFDYVSQEPGEKVVVMDVYNFADLKGSENIAWIYDCDFEYLAHDSIKKIILTGVRAADQHLRLLIAGVPAERIQRASTEAEALSLLELNPHEAIYIIHGLDEAEIGLKMKRDLKALIQQKRGS